MQAVQVTVEAEHLRSALQDLLVRAVGTDRDRTLVLRLDPEKGTLAVQDAGPDSLYTITLPVQAASGGDGPIRSRLAVRKLEPLLDLLQSVRGRTAITFRKTTMLFQGSKKHLLVPNHLLGPAEPEAIATEKQPIARFVIPDAGALKEALATARETALRVRLGGGVVLLQDESYPADIRQSGEYLWPRAALCDRLLQLPPGTKVQALVTEKSVTLLTALLPVVREIKFNPYPSTTLYTPKPNLINASLWSEKDRKQREKRPPLLRDLPTLDDVIADEKPLPPLPEEPAQEPEADVPPISDVPEAAVDTELEVEPDESEEPPVDAKASALALLDGLPGLQHVKKQVRAIAQFAAFEKERGEVLGVAGMRPTLHMSFLGNPGTGKTMVARMLGQVFKQLGLLTKGHVVEVDRQKLVGQYMGHTEANLAKYVKRALGGILFIDEAYALYKKDSGKDFGNTAIHGLVKAMEDHRENLVVIVAGYKHEMHEFFNFNPGLRARVPFHLEFPDYTKDELLAIADYLAAEDHYTLTADAKDALLRAALREKIDETFGNARAIRNLLEKAKISHAVHASEKEGALEPEAYTQLTAQDFRSDTEDDADTLESVLVELDALVGLDEVKQMVRQMTEVLQLEKKRLAHGLEDQPLTLHMSFTGNPGTGKTTVARLIGRLLRVLNLLPKGHFVEASRKDLVAGYVGQTALKTSEKIREALGGVLFLDEAYALAKRGREEFGAEALAGLIKEMEDKKGLLTVILAGYTHEMETLFRLNPGLKSRVRFHLHFPDYTASDLVEIVKRKAEGANYRLTEAAEEKLWTYFLRACLAAEDDFGNGRLAEQLFERAKIHLSGRIARMEGDIEKEVLMTITDEDIEPTA